MEPPMLVVPLFGIIDDLVYSYYNGTNCLQNIADDYGSYGYNDQGGNYLNDQSGNITRDPSKKCDLYYNHLNKLDSIVLDNGTSIHFYQRCAWRASSKKHGRYPGCLQRPVLF